MYNTQIDAPNWLEYLKKHDYFRLDDFIKFLKSKYPGNNQGILLDKLLYAILLDAAENHNYDDGEFLEWLTSIIPDLTYQEVAQFASDKMKRKD